VTSANTRTSQPESPPPRLEGEGQGGGVDKERRGEDAFAEDFCHLQDQGVDKERQGVASFAEELCHVQVQGVERSAGAKTPLSRGFAHAYR